MEAVLRHEAPEVPLYSMETPAGALTLTGNHRVYVTPTDKVACEDLREGDCVVTVREDRLLYVPITRVRALPARPYVYDLSVETYHNYIVGSEAFFTVSNSPDRNYHFRPPESEANIGAYNRVFGEIWRDYELVEHLERALDWWNMMPPFTGGMDTIDQLVRDKPAWRTAIIWQAVVHACFALQANWTADEFSLEYEEKVRVYLPDGSVEDVPIGELYEICEGSAK